MDGTASQKKKIQFMEVYWTHLGTPYFIIPGAAIGRAERQSHAGLLAVSQGSEKNRLEGAGKLYNQIVLVAGCNRI